MTTNQVLYYSLTLKASKMIGRQKWYRNTESKLSKDITLTSCLQDQFTCSDGSCIPLKMACNFQADCHDRSDESKYCEIGLYPPDLYNEKLPYSAFAENSTRLGLYFNMLRIERVNIEENRIEMQANVQVS